MLNHVSSVMESRHFFRDRDICQDTGIKTGDEPRHFRLDRDETRCESSFKYSRHKTLQDTGSKTRDESRH